MLPLTRECAFFWRIMEFVTSIYEQAWAEIEPYEPEDSDLLIRRIEEAFFLNVPRPIGFY